MADIQLTKEQQQKIAAGLLAACVAAFLYVKFFWLPVSRNIEETKSKLESLQGKIRMAEATAARLPQLRRRLAELEVLAQQAEARLPKQKEVPRLIEMLSDLAREHHVEILSIGPAGGSPRENYQENLYALQIQGSYLGVAHFLTGLGLEERILHARNLSLTPVSSDTQPGFSVGAQFTLVVFQYKG